MSETKLKRKILTAGILMIFCYGMANNTVGFFVTPVSQAMGCSVAAFNLYYTIACVVSLLTAPLFGRLLQVRNARHIMLFGCVLGSASMFAFSLCTRVSALYPAAAVLGLVQQGTTSIVAMVLINRAWSGSAGSATGLVMSGTGICSTSMSFVLPALIERMGWQQGYRLQAVLWLVLMSAAWLLTKNTVEHPDDETAAAAAADSAEGITLPQAMHGSALYILFICFTAQGTCTIFLQHLPSYMIELGRSTAESSMVMGLFSAMLIVGKLIIGAMYDRLGSQKTLLVNCLSLALGMWLMLTGGTAALCVGAILFSFGNSSVTVLFPLITGEVFGRREYAAIWGVMSMAVSCGTACGAPIWGAMFDHFRSYRPQMTVMPALMLVNVCAMLWVMRRRSVKTMGLKDTAE